MDITLSSCSFSFIFLNKYVSYPFNEQLWVLYHFFVPGRRYGGFWLPASSIWNWLMMTLKILCHSFMTLTSKVTLRKLVFNSQRTVLTKIDNFKDRAQNYFDNHSLEIPFMPGNFHDDLIFTFFLLSFLYRKIFNAQKLYPVLLGIGKILNRKNRLTQIKKVAHFPHFSATRKKKPCISIGYNIKKCDWKIYGRTIWDQ